MGRRNIELDDAIGAILDRPGEELAAGEITLAIAVDKHAILDGECEIGAMTFYAHLLMPNEPVDEALLLRGDFLPARDRIRIIEKTDVKHEFLKFAQRHLRVLDVGSLWIEG